jgi:hypothetical protein
MCAGSIWSFPNGIDAHFPAQAADMSGSISMGCHQNLKMPVGKECLGALSVPLNVEYVPIQAVTLRRHRG